MADPDLPGVPDAAAAGIAAPGAAATVTAVVVTYHPVVAATAALLDALAPQVGRVVVVDDGSPDPTVAGLHDAAAQGLLPRMDDVAAHVASLSRRS